MAMFIIKVMLWSTREPQRNESGMATAELLGNAALGIGALVGDGYPKDDPLVPVGGQFHIVGGPEDFPARGIARQNLGTSV